jgi:hypothetical protein
MQTNGIPTLTVPFQAAQSAASGAALRAGQVLQGMVRQTGDGLAIQAAGIRAPLPEGTGLHAGQAVTVEVLDTSVGLQLRVTPQTAAAPTATSPLDALVAQVLTTLNAQAPPDVLARMLPQNLPQTQEAIRALVNLFLARGTTGADLQHVAGAIEQAVTAGVLTSAETKTVLALIGRFEAADQAQFQAVLRQLADASGRTVEGRIALAIASGRIDEAVNAARAGLREQLVRLRENPALRAFLRTSGQLRTFESSVDRVLDRMLGSQLQNLRSLEQPYLFIEIPGQPNGSLVHGQLHFFADGNGKRRGFAEGHTMVAMDLRMSRLGDMWIALRTVHGHCVCQLRAVDPGAREALTAASDELALALEGAGYPGARVEVTGWDGDRLRETAALMHRFSGLNVKA